MSFFLSKTLQIGKVVVILHRKAREIACKSPERAWIETEIEFLLFVDDGKPRAVIVTALFFIHRSPPCLQVSSLSLCSSCFYESNKGGLAGR